MKHLASIEDQVLKLNAEPVDTSSPEERLRKSQNRWKRGSAAVALALTAYLMLPTRAHAQFTSIFNSIFSSIQNDMGVSLKAINQVTQDTQELYQVTMWPLAQINQIRGFVSNTISSYRNVMNMTFSAPYSSATLPAPQQLESILHSQQSSQIGALQQSFSSNFGTIPQTNNASPQDRVMMDIDDALAQESLKTTLLSDEAGNTVLQSADSMESQVALSTPGSNPFLTAQSQVANLRCQAFIQKMLTAELRQEAGRIAHDNVLLKRKASSTGSVTSLISGALSAR